MFLPPVSNSDIFNRHLFWVDRGYSFDDIAAIRKDIKEFFPFSPLGTRTIQQRIGGVYPEKEVTVEDLKKLTFLLIDDCDFDSDLQFLRYATNLEKLVVSGRCSDEKIHNIKPLRHLKKIQKLQLDHQEIEDVSALSELSNLKWISLFSNPIRTLEPLMNLKAIQKAEFSDIAEKEVFELLRNSKQAQVSFTSLQDGYSYDAFWINNWAYKTTYFKDHSHIITTIEPLTGAKRTLMHPTAPENLKVMLRKSQDVAGLLLGKCQKIINSEFSYQEKNQLLKGYFEYQSTGSVVFDLHNAQN